MHLVLWVCIACESEREGKKRDEVREGEKADEPLPCSWDSTWKTDLRSLGDMDSWTECREIEPGCDDPDPSEARNKEVSRRGSCCFRPNDKAMLYLQLDLNFFLLTLLLL